MAARRLAFAALALVLPGAATIAPPVYGAGDVSFPKDFTAGVLYATVDRPEFRWVLELFAPAEALAAARKGEPLPYGTVLTVRRFSVRLNAEGMPVRDAGGRFVKDELLGFSVMEKRDGWGADHPPALRNGDWKFRTFTPAGQNDRTTDLSVCLQCHKKQDKQDFVFSRIRMMQVSDAPLPPLSSGLELAILLGDEVVGQGKAGHRLQPLGPGDEVGPEGDVETALGHEHHAAPAAEVGDAASVAD